MRKRRFESLEGSGSIEVDRYVGRSKVNDGNSKCIFEMPGYVTRGGVWDLGSLEHHLRRGQWTRASKRFLGKIWRHSLSEWGGTVLNFLGHGELRYMMNIGNMKDHSIIEAMVVFSLLKVLASPSVGRTTIFQVDWASLIEEDMESRFMPKPRRSSVRLTGHH